MTACNRQNGMNTHAASSFFANLFSSVLEEEVTPRQARLIINAIIAALMLPISAALPFWATALVLGWFLLALNACRKAGLGETAVLP